MKLKIAAVIALAFCLLGLVLSLGTYALTLVHSGHVATIQRFLWPVNTVVHSVPVLALCIGILVSDRQ